MKEDFANLYADLSDDINYSYEDKLWDKLDHLVECISDPNTFVNRDYFWDVWRTLRSIRDYRIYCLNRGVSDDKEL